MRSILQQRPRCQLGRCLVWPTAAAAAAATQQNFQKTTTEGLTSGSLRPPAQPAPSSASFDNSSAILFWSLDRKAGWRLSVVLRFVTAKVKRLGPLP